MNQSTNEASWGHSVDLGVLDAVSKASFFSEASEEEELTVLELAHVVRAPSKFYLFLHSPYYPEPFYRAVRSFFKEVWQRRIELRDFERIHYANTIWQKLCLAGRKTVLHLKTNLLTGP